MAAKAPRLRFTEEERADPNAGRAVRRAEQAAGKAEKVGEKARKKSLRFVDPKTGEITVKMRWEGKKPPARPLYGVENAAAGAAEALRSGDRESVGNAGGESAGLLLDTAGAGSRLLRGAAYGGRLRFTRKAARAEEALGKANLRALYKLELSAYRRKSGEKPGVLKKQRVKRMIRKRYAGAVRAERAGGAASRYGARGIREAKKAGGFLRRHRRGLCLVLAVFLVLCLFMSFFSSCTALVGGSLPAVLSTYPSEDGAMLGAERAYAALEDGLKATVDQESYKSRHSYDEYLFRLDPIGHDPHALVSLITAYYGRAWTLEEAGPLVASLFGQQYALTEQVETKERQERIPVPGPGGEMVPGPATETVEYTTCTVTLKSRDLPEIAREILSAERYELFSLYLQLRGNRPDLFQGIAGAGGGPTDLSGVRFVNGARPGNQRVVEIARSQEGNVGGYPYWSWYGFGGWVDWCAAFVSWCYNQAGYTEPRFSSCTYGGRAWFQAHGQWAARGYAHIAPGDAIFFDWDLSGDCDHVGIVIGTDGSRVYTVEGNSDNACRVRSYPLDYDRIAGYGLMN